MTLEAPSKNGSARPISQSLWLIGCVLILIACFVSRMPHLLTLPLFIDEATHLTRAQDVWQGQPLELFLNGKAGPLYLIALFDPYHAPIWLGRFITVLCGAIGVASAIGIGRALGSKSAGLLAGILWVGCPYLFFFERTILVDAPLAAFATFAAWTAIRMMRGGRIIDAFLCGVALLLCAFDKVTGLIFFCLPVAALILPGLVNWRALRIRTRQIVITYGFAGVVMILPVWLIISQQDNILGIGALTSTNTSTLSSRLAANAQLTIGAFQTYFNPLLLAVIVLCAIFALLDCPRRAAIGLALFGVPIVILISVGQSLYLRYLVIAVPGLLITASIGVVALADYLAGTIKGLHSVRLPILLPLAVSLLVLAAIIPFARTAYADPTLLPIPINDQHEYILDWSGGYGLREAAADLIGRAQTANQPLTVIGMVGSCNIVRLYVPIDSLVTVECPDVWDPTGTGMLLGEQEIASQQATGQALVLGEDNGPVPDSAIPQPRGVIQRYLRPGGAYTVNLYTVMGH